jgi:amino-acid N-acetyltransferase
MKIEKAKASDATSIQQLINHFVSQDDILPRALSEIYENIRDFFVVREGNQVIACAGLHIDWIDLAEIRSLAAIKEDQHQGIGSSLVQACLNEAKELGITTVYCLTRRPSFFEEQGFQLVDKMELPRKVWGDCYRCPKFPDCDASALIYHI